jgi:biotin operon repressor
VQAGVLEVIFNARHLDAVQKMVMLAILKPINEIGQSSFQSEETIAKLAGCSRSTVQRTIKSLKEMGVITVERFYENHSKHPVNHYTPTKMVSYSYYTRNAKRQIDALLGVKMTL